jgi:hypothetical protein
MASDLRIPTDLSYGWEGSSTSTFVLQDGLAGPFTCNIVVSTFWTFRRVICLKRNNDCHGEVRGSGKVENRDVRGE